MNNMRRESLICVALLIIPLIGFWPVGRLDFSNYDDWTYVFKNTNVQAGITAESVCWAFTTTHACNWHPVTWLSHMLDCQLFGLKAGGHHWTNLGFHIANTLLLFLVLKEMTETVWRSALVAALFALHPLRVESVAWISERKDVLSGFFMLLTLWAYARYAQGAGNREQGGKTSNIQHPTSNAQWCYWLAVFFFTLGLMSKPMLVTLPVILLLLDFWPLKRISDLKSASQPRKGAWPRGAALRGFTPSTLIPHPPRHARPRPRRRDHCRSVRRRRAPGIATHPLWRATLALRPHQAGFSPLVAPKRSEGGQTRSRPSTLDLRP